MSGNGKRLGPVDIKLHRTSAWFFWEAPVFKNTDSADELLYQCGLTQGAYEKGLTAVNEKVPVKHSFVLTYRLWLWYIPLIPVAAFLFTFCDFTSKVGCTADRVCSVKTDAQGASRYAYEIDEDPSVTAIGGEPTQCCAFYCCKKTTRRLEPETSDGHDSRMLTANHTLGSYILPPVTGSGSSCEIAVPDDATREPLYCTCPSGDDNDEKSCKGKTKVLGPHEDQSSVWWPLLISTLLLLSGPFAGVRVKSKLGNTIIPIVKKEWNAHSTDRATAFAFEYHIGDRHNAPFLRVFLPEKPLAAQVEDGQKKGNQVGKGNAEGNPVLL
ncbi:unnamed protein product [Amoebophrya sp. A25]|nr:unnamed protein product [Amoebophrya sp. A25]|eukprot:GSA25T00006719001.1